MISPKGTPAYKGARFDANGYCLAHSDVQLCRPTADRDGGRTRYRIVRKTCFKCGSAALMTDNSHGQRTNVHGYKKQPTCHRVVPSELLTAGVNNGRGAGVNNGRGTDEGGDRRDRVKDGANLGSGGDERRRRSNETRHREDQRRRRARTLSPKRIGRGKSVPPSSTTATATTRTKKQPLSSSHVIQRMPAETLKGLMGLRMPSFTSKTSSKAGSDDNYNEGGHQGCSKKKVGHHRREKSTASEVHQEEAKTSVEGVGRCHAHPEVQLAIRRTIMNDGKWKIVKDVCPHCFPTEKSMPLPCSSTPPCSPTSVMKVPIATDDVIEFPIVPTPQPDNYFSHALVVFCPNKAGDEGECFRRSPTTSNNDYGRMASNSNWKVLPNSTARMARSSRTKKRSGGLAGSGGSRAYEAWESLPC